MLIHYCREVRSCGAISLLAMMLMERSLAATKPAFQVTPLWKSARTSRVSTFLKIASNSGLACRAVRQKPCFPASSLLNIATVGTGHHQWGIDERVHLSLWASKDSKPTTRTSRAKGKPKTFPLPNETKVDASSKASAADFAPPEVEIVGIALGDDGVDIHEDVTMGSEREPKTEEELSTSGDGDAPIVTAKRPRGRPKKAEVSPAGMSNREGGQGLSSAQGLVTPLNSKRPRSSTASAAVQREHSREVDVHLTVNNDRGEADEEADDSVRAGTIAAEVDVQSKEDVGYMRDVLVTAKDESMGELGNHGTAAAEHEANSPSSSSASKTSSRRSSPGQKVFQGLMPAAHVDPTAVPTEKRIREFSFTGRCQEAIDLLASIRGSGLRPSMAASMDVIGVCRRALRLDTAELLYRQMVDEHLPDHLFREFAAPVPEDESKRLVERACAIALMMEEDPYEPKDEETYRGLLLCAREDGCWQVAVLLGEQAQRDGITLGVYSVDMLCSLLMGAGHEDVSAMMYEKYILDRGDEVSEEAWNVGRVASQVVELHNLTSSAALATVRLMLTDLVTEPTTRVFLSKERAIRIITGMGHNSEGGEAVIKVMSLLDRMGIEHGFKHYNEGCIVIEPYALREFIERTASGQGAAVPGVQLACSSIANVAQQAAKLDDNEGSGSK